MSPRSQGTYPWALDRVVNGALFVRVTARGVHRVLNGWAGLVLRVDSLTEGLEGRVIVHAQDLRYPNEHRPWQVWSLGPEEYEFL